MFNGLNQFQEKSVRLSYEGKLHLSPILLDNFHYEEYDNSICLYSNGDNIAMVWKEDVKSVETYDETILINFKDSSYIILGSEVDYDENTNI